MARQTTTFRRRPTASRTTRVRRSTRSRRPTAARSRTRSRNALRASPTKRSRRSTGPTRSRTSSRSARGRQVQGTQRRSTDRGIERFLEGFTQALTSGDGRAAAACFEYPSLMVMSAVGDYGGNQPIADPETAARFFDQAPQQYNAKGIEQTFPDVEDVQWISHDLALARVHFPYIGADGNDLGDGETSVYVLRKQHGDYAICAAITLGADSDRPRTRRGSR